jgi:N-acetylglucosaminyl-diphospho-decaprenol L-rhamnosyltransferase
VSRVAAVVVTHGPHSDVDDCLRMLAGQVNELVVIANLPGTRPVVPEGTRLVVNDHPAGFAANVNKGLRMTTAPLVIIANPDAVACEKAVLHLSEFMEAHPRCAVAGPQLAFPDGQWQPSRRRFPTVAGTLLRRTPLRLLFPPQEYNRSHYQLDETVPTEPATADWMMAAFWLVRRSAFEELGGMDESFHLYCEDIDFCYRAERAGWERWYVPDALVVHRHGAVTDRKFLDRHTLWHVASMLHFIRKHPERLKALR